MNILAMFGWGTTEWILIGIIAVLLFGRRLPEVGKNLGKSLMEFKAGLKGTTDELSEVNDAVDEVNKAVQQPPETAESEPSEQNHQ